MTEAPEKMWVFPKDDWFIAGASNVPIVAAGANNVEYTRSDIANAAVVDLIAQNAELIKKTERMKKVIYELLDERRELQIELQRDPDVYQ